MAEPNELVDYTEVHETQMCDGNSECFRLEAELVRLRSEVERLERERTELLLDRHQPDRISPCGHYRVFAMPCVHEDGTETPSCMHCDRDASQDALATLRSEVERLQKLLQMAVYYVREDYQSDDCRVCGVEECRGHRSTCWLYQSEAELNKQTSAPGEKALEDDTK